MSVTALFIIMKNVSNQMSDNRRFWKINTMEFNAVICWRRMVFYNMRKCLQHTKWKNKAGFQTSTKQCPFGNIRYVQREKGWKDTYPKCWKWLSLRVTLCIFFFWVFFFFFCILTMLSNQYYRCTFLLKKKVNHVVAITL